MLREFSMSFDGRLLERGFWLYVCEIKGPQCHYIYVGRTGDTSSPNASSPFRRIGQYLDPSPNAKGNALHKQLRKCGVACDECSFQMIALGPVFPEQATFDAHVPYRNRMATLERAVAEELRYRGYVVLGEHPRIGVPDVSVFQEIQAILAARFPGLASD
jgi:hypothetical protein